MAMGGSGHGGGSRRGRRTRRRGALSEINVTPMVDVMLVLLIIFMISAPLKDEGEPVTVSIDKTGQLYVNDDPASYDQVAPRLLAITRGDTETQIYVRGAGEATWDSVARVMGKLSSSGFTKISLVTDTMGKPAATAAEPESVTP